MKEMICACLLLILPAIASAAEKPAKAEMRVKADYKHAVSHFSAKCRVGTSEFTLHLGDTLKEPDSESVEMGFGLAWLTFGKKGLVEALPAMQYNELLFLKPKGDSLCDETLALKQANGTVAIFLRQNGRPFEDFLSVIFFDPKKNKVLASRRELGRASVVEETSKGTEFMIKDSPSDVGDFTVTVKGKTSKTSEEVTETWNLISREGGKVIVATDKDRTWEKSKYQGYFKNQAEFDKIFGWDDKAKVYSGFLIYHTDDPDCIQVQVGKARKATNEDPWTCRK